MMSSLVNRKLEKEEGSGRRMTWDLTRISEENYENFQDNLPSDRGLKSRLPDYEAEVETSRLRRIFLLIIEDKQIICQTKGIY